MTPRLPDDIRWRVTDQIWIGTLHGKQVHVLCSGDSRWFAVTSPQGHTDALPASGVVCLGGAVESMRLHFRR